MYLLRGALTSKPYSFVARPWEFKSIESIDFFDSIGAAIRFDIRGDKIIRVLPRLHEDINEEWISDRTRFSVDGFRLQRIDGPLLNINQAFKNLSWVNAVYFLSNLLFKTKDLNFDFLMNFGQIKNQNLNVNYFNDSFSDFENEIWLNLFTSCFFFKKNNIILNRSISLRDDFLFNFKLKDIGQYKYLSLIGINIRYESPVFNIRLRQQVLKFGLQVINFGFNFLSTFPILFLGGVKTLIKFLSGSHWFFSSFIKAKSLLIFNSLYIKNIQFSSIRRTIRNNIPNINVGTFFRNSSLIIGQEVNNLSVCENNKSWSFNLFNSLPFLDNLQRNRDLISSTRDQISISLSHHGDNRLSKIDFVIPTSAPFERQGLLVNNEGRVQHSRFIISSPNNVLDLRDSIIFVITCLFRKSHKSNDDFFSLNHILSVFYSVLVSNPELSWAIVKKFFHLNENKLSISLLLKELFSFVFYYIKEDLFLESLNLGFSNSLAYSKLMILNKPTFDLVDNYYIQDEISSASLSLISANKQLSPKLTYY